MSWPSTRIRPYLVSFDRISIGPGPDGAGPSVGGGSPDAVADGGDGTSVDGDDDSGAADDGWANPPDAGPARCSPPQPPVSRPKPAASTQAALTPSRILCAPSRGRTVSMGRRGGPCPYGHGRHRRFPGSVGTSFPSFRPSSAPPR